MPRPGCDEVGAGREETCQEEEIARSELHYRRSPNVVAYWDGGALVCHNFATGSRVTASALVVALLDYFGDWRPVGPLLAQSTVAPRRIRRVLAMLHRASILQRSDKAPPPVERRMEVWRSWNPAAGFFHFSTKNTRYRSSIEESGELLRARAAERPSPAPVKHSAGGVSTPLPRGRRVTGFDSTLLQRRTWRRFGRGPIALGDLGALLWLTFGVQHWVDLGIGGHAMLRTSPSAGARNPLEAYVIAQRVDGLRRRLYHYDPDAHRLVDVGPVKPVARYVPGQPWYARAAVLVFITAVFPRTEWKYPFPRAYRTIQLEAGHFAQTFCLAATSRGLAPFCTAALADSVIERDLGIDGVSESVIYACGVGIRPPRVDWAPWPEKAEVPRLLEPASAKRSRRT